MKKTPAWQVELRRLARASGGVLAPSEIVQSAKNPKSPLHKKFTWDDTEAAHNYRLWQARQLLKIFVTVVPSTKTEERVFVSLTTDRNSNGGYRPLVDVLSDDTLRGQLLEDAKLDMQRFKLKYGRLKELAKVFAAMEEIP